MTADAIEELANRVHAMPDPEARSAALGLVQAVMDLHASGLNRLMEILSGLEHGEEAIEAMAADANVCGLLLLHDLHPIDIETRVARALDRPEFRSRRARVELISTAGGVVRVHVQGGAALAAAVEATLLEAAPDAVDIRIEGAAQAKNGFVPVEALVQAGM